MLGSIGIRPHRKSGRGVYRREWGGVGGEVRKSGWDRLGCFWGGVGKVLGAEAPRGRGLPGASGLGLRSPGGRGGVASPRTAPCAASAPRGGPAPVAMGTAAAARLARGSPASVSGAPGAGGVG